MLTAADLDLLRRERHIPGMRLALDADALLAHFVPRWPAHAPAPTHASVGYLRYKPGTSLLAGLTLHTPAGRTDAYVRAFHPDATAKLAKLRTTGAADDVGWGAVIDDDLALAVVDATSDRRLPGLRALLAATTADVEPLRYKPERRWVAALGREGRRHRLVKVHRPGVGYAGAGVHGALAAAGLPVPELVSADPSAGVVTYEWIEGTALDQQLPAPAALAATGELLARLHTTGTTKALPMSDPAAEVAEGVDAIVAALPACATVAQSAAFSAYGALPTSRRVLVHGDLSADQVIVRTAPPGLTLVDLDRARIDDPAADLASWVAAELVAGRAPADAEPEDVLGPLLDAYLAAGGVDVRDALAAQTALALLRRAVDPFRTRMPDWPDRVRTLVHAADRLAHRASVR